MYVAQRRLDAKVIAYFDMIAITISAGFIMLPLTSIAFTGYQVRYPTQEGNLNYPILLAVSVLTVFILGVQLVAAVRLRSATMSGTAAKESLEYATFWKKVTLTFLPLVVIGIVIRQYLLACVIALVWRVVAIHLVGQYIKELEVKAIAGDKTNQSPGA